MSKFVCFPLQQDDQLIVYPDDIELFAGTIIVDGVIHSQYFGDKELEASDYFRQQLLPSAVQSIKQAAYQVIAELGGEGGWRNQRAQDRKDLGDSALYDQLLAAREAVRGKSNDLEAEVATMAYGDLVAFNPLETLRQAVSLTE